MTKIDDDVLKLGRIAMRKEVQRLRDAIRLHRDQRGDDRCWIDDERLYGTLPEGAPANTALDPKLMLRNCERFVQLRCHPRDRFDWGDAPGGSMIPMLEQAERELPSLLKSADGWNSLHIDDVFPRTERVWMPYGEGRLCLQIEHPCGVEEALFCPRPWPLAMRVCKGWFETAYGYGPSDGPVPTPGASRVIGGRKPYEIVDPRVWHYVRPLGDPVKMVLVSGKPWGLPNMRKPSGLQPLPAARVEEILAMFRDFYPLPQ
jgi:hypothetical protein